MRRSKLLWQILAVVVGLLIATISWATPDFDTFFEQHSTPMWMIAVGSGEILRANPAAKAFYGFKQLEGMNINEINMLTPEQVSTEIERTGVGERTHLYFRHRLASGDVKVMGVYTDRFDVNGRSVLISSLYDTSDFESSAERHYIQRVEEQVDLQTQQLQASRQRTFWLAVIATLMQLSVIIVLLILLLRLRRSQREKRQLIDELSFRNRELKRLSHVMAHHFQEPSRRLASFAQQLSRQLDTSTDNTITTAVGFIDSQARRLSNLVSDVQRYLSLDSIAPVSQNIDPNAIIYAIYESDPQLEAARLAQALEIPQPLPNVWADPQQVKLIFRVLLHNAWQYRDEQRPLLVQVSAKTAQGRVIFRVEDNGSGIASQYRTQVLEMFSRLVPNNEQYPGTGMGLSLVVKALRSVNGQVSIEDGQQGGTAIVFDLPATR
ncbi:sensor histidine kinase [Vreelandella aquamarina]